MTWSGSTVTVPANATQAVQVWQYHRGRRFGTLVHRGNTVVYLGPNSGIRPNGQGTVPFYPTDSVRVRNWPEELWVIGNATTPQSLSMIEDTTNPS